MALLAIVLAVIALPLAIAHLPVAGMLLAAAAALASTALARQRGRRTAAVALALVTLGGGLAGFELIDARRALPTGAIDESRYQRAGVDREVQLPLTITRMDITALALLELADEVDEIYSGFEPQRLVRETETGLRVIAYRHDGYVDIYDSLSLTAEADPRSPVTGHGLKHYRQEDFGETVLHRTADGRVEIAVSFTDVSGRRIAIAIAERPTGDSRPLPMLAPVGLSAAVPEYFPFFVLPDFDFLRTTGAQMAITVDGQPRQIAPFPVPLPVQGQWRNFGKYAEEATLYQVFPTVQQELPTLTTSGDLVMHDGVRYLFAGQCLEAIAQDQLEILFDPPLCLETAGQGGISMTSYPEQTRVGGPYTVTVQGAQTTLQIAVDEVALPQQRGVLYRLILSGRSVFAQWPLHYAFTATYDRESGAYQGEWTNSWE